MVLLRATIEYLREQVGDHKLGLLHEHEEVLLFRLLHDKEKPFAAH
jgi:hypothetical protein